MNHNQYYIAAQNDMLYITKGKAPALSNDHHNPDADRTPIAKVYDIKDAQLIVDALTYYTQCYLEQQVEAHV